MEEKFYYYNKEYYTVGELYEKYKKLSKEQKKRFRDTLAHFALVEIMKKCHYDERIMICILELADTEVLRIRQQGIDCGVVSLALEKMYKTDLRTLLNLTGKLAVSNDRRMNDFKNGEWLLNNIICLTIGYSYEKEIIDDLFIIDYNSLSEDECLAISDNFVRCMKEEEIVFYKNHTRGKGR